MMKLMYNFLIDSYTISDNYFYNYVTMLLIGLLAYKISYLLIGKLFVYNLLDGYMQGHILHWLLRLPIFLIIFSCCTSVINIYKKLCNYIFFDKKWLFVIIIGIYICCCILFEIICQHRKKIVKRRKNKRN